IHPEARTWIAEPNRCPHPGTGRRRLPARPLLRHHRALFSSQDISMNRRQFSAAASSVLGLATMAAWRQAHALSLGDLTPTEASQGLKAALERGALAAVGLLGKPGGFLDNPKVRIPLPGFLADAGRFMRAMGRGQQVDELEVAMNRAADAAVPLARELLTHAVKSMSVNDAKNILAGGDTSVTDFFAEKTRTPLAGRFLPV